MRKPEAKAREGNETMSATIIKKFTATIHIICPSCNCMIKKGEGATEIRDNETGEEMILCSHDCREFEAERAAKKDTGRDSLQDLHYS